MPNEGGTFAEACALLKSAIGGTTRAEIVDDAARSSDLGKALLRLREGLRSNTLRARPVDIGLDPFVRRFDRRTRGDGFHALHDWDGKADRVNAEIIPVDVLDYLIERRGTTSTNRTTLTILLDYYLMHVLALVSLRVWDEGNADSNLERVEDLLADLQGPNGSGQRFVANAETLILIATSHFEVVERGYGKLLDRVRTLAPRHQARIALGHAVSIGSHLRFGFEATYGRDTLIMRDDNIADYPWLCFALVTLMREYARTRENDEAEACRDVIVEAVLNGLSADARAFIGATPAALTRCEAERSEFRERFDASREDLLAQFESHRPLPRRYSPLSFFFNFSHNVLKGTVVDALLRGQPWHVGFNDLLTGLPKDEASSDSKEALAKTLMAYARDNPDRIRGRLTPVIVYDSRSGQRAFTTTMRKIRQ